MNTIRISVFACAAAAALRASATPLFSGGTTDWKIAYEACEKNTPVEYGARELQAALRTMSGAEFAAGEGAAGAKTLYIGVDRTLPKPGDEVVVIRLKGDSVELVGNEPRAALHAVYAFLQRELGVRWLWPGKDGEFIPKRESWEVPTKGEWRHTPSIKYRGFHCCGDWYKRDQFLDWAARNFVTTHRHGFRRDAERRHGFYNFVSSHNASLNRRKDLFAEHPEYFCEIGGRRVKVNLCFSSEGAVDEVVKQLAGDIRGRKIPLDVLSIFPADNQDYCKCAECKKMSVSDGWFGFYNKVVTKLRKDFPDVKFATLAYQGYRAAPSFPVVETEFVEYASHGRCNRHCWNDPDCPPNARDLKLMDTWENREVRVGEYGYEYDMFIKNNIWTPFFSFVSDEIDNAARKKHVCLITEIGMSPRNGPDTAVDYIINRLTTLLYAQKMWDASLTVEAFFDDLTKTAFGPAAAPMKRYLETMDRAWGRDHKMHNEILGSGLWVCKSVLDEPTKAACDAAFAEAEKAIAGATDQQKLAFVREKALYRQWCDLLDAANGNSKVLRLPKLAKAGTIPSDACAAQPLVGRDGKPTATTVRTAWVGSAKKKVGTTMDEVRVQFEGVPSDAAATVRFFAATGIRYAFTVAADGTTRAECISEVGIRETSYAPGWKGARRDGAVRLAIPAAAFKAPVLQDERLSMHFSVDGKAPAGLPEKDNIDITAAFTSIRHVDVPAFSCQRVLNHRRISKPAEKAAFQDAGFDAAVTETAAEAEAAVDPKQRVFLFQAVGLKPMSEKVRETVRTAVSDGGIAMFYYYSNEDIAGFMGDKAFATKLRNPSGGTLAERRAVYCKPGDWLERPFTKVGSRMRGGIMPAYGHTPVNPEGWVDYVRGKGGENGVPVLTAHPYGKGRVFVAGTYFAVSVQQILANLWEEYCDEADGLAAKAGPRTFDIRDYGAKPSGGLQTEAVQKAIDAAAAAGGGRVVVPEGTYLVGTVWLKSHVELHLEKGAVLKGSPNLADYNANEDYPQNWWSPGEGWSGKHLVIALEVEDVAITGEGAIDGNGTAFLNPDVPPDPVRKARMAYRLGYVNLPDRKTMARPGQELAFYECRGIRIEGVTLRNMAMWTCFLYGCDDVDIRGVTIRNDLRFANTDGFDVDACRNVRITDCDVSTADDAFAIRCCPRRLKSKRAVCENIAIDRCKVRTECEVVRIGVGDGLVRNVRITNLDVSDAGRGFVVQSIYPGTKYKGLGIENVYIADCDLKKVVQAIAVTAGTPNATSPLKDVTFERVRANLEGGVMVNGLGQTRPTNIRFKDVALTAVSGDYALGHDWEVGKMDTDPGNVIRVERADDVVFDNVKVVNGPGVERPRIATCDVKRVTCDGCVGIRPE